MATGQIIGSTITNTLEVDANTRAAHAHLRAEDAPGIFSMSGVTGVMAAGLAAFSTVYSFRWGAATGACALIKRITLSAGVDTVAFAAGTCWFDLYIARGWTASDSGGTTLTPSGNSNKLRTSMSPSLVTDARISSTAVLTLGTRTRDPNAFSSWCVGGGLTAGARILPPTPILDVRPGEFPLILERNEGFMIIATVPATGTWKMGVKVDWLEVANIDSYFSVG